MILVTTTVTVCKILHYSVVTVNEGFGGFHDWVVVHIDWDDCWQMAILSIQVAVYYGVIHNAAVNYVLYDGFYY